MFLDTAHNTLPTVLRNIHGAFLECATKMWTYARCLPVAKQPGLNLLKKTLGDVVELAFVLMKSKSRSRGDTYRCGVTKAQVDWLAMNAFRDVLKRRQSKYGGLLEWIDGRMSRMESGLCRQLRDVVSENPTID